MKYKHHKIKDFKPRLILDFNKTYVISRVVKKDLKITDVSFVLNDNDIIEDIILRKDQRHPNCNPDNQKFCKTDLHGSKYNENTINEFIDILRVYNFESCFFTEWEGVRWEY